MKLKVFETLKANDRISSIDIFRALAIIPVVIYHFDGYLPYGYLGVDLFFLISGLLVGGILTKLFLSDEEINLPKFLLQRGFKIWPSYYFFLAFGSLIAYFFFRKISPEQIIPFHEIKRYIFFYENYIGVPIHKTFDHIWSLCVEEHFYILLPVGLILIGLLFKNKKRSLFIFLIVTIILGFLFKIASLKFTNGKDTYSGTHNRIDALAWGVMLNLVIISFGEKLRNLKRSYWITFLGIALFATNVFIKVYFANYFYDKVIFHSIAPFTFFLMILGVYYKDFSKQKVLRFFSYYSYNWYLWHPIFAIFITKVFGASLLTLIVYLVVSFAMAFFSTIFIEEYFLGYRKNVINYLFGKKLSPVKAE